jgi:hypothetical protein
MARDSGTDQFIRLMAQGLGHSGNLRGSIGSPTTLMHNTLFGILDACVVSHLHDIYSKDKSKVSISKENYSADKCMYLGMYHIKVLCHSVLLF